MMNPWTRLLAIAGITTLVLASHANAHSWYSEKIDPVFKTPCCGGHDCASWTILPGELTPETNGIRVRLSLEHTRLINPKSIAPIDALVIWDRIQPSEDGNWHLCISEYAREERADHGIYCLFMPPNM